MQFSEAMDPATVSTATFGLRVTGAPTDVPATVTLVGATATLTPSSLLALDTEYTVTVLGAVADPAGNLLGGPDTWAFTTVPPDLTNPVISGLEAAVAPDGTTATVQWGTDELATSVVNYGTTSGALSQSASTGGHVLGHVVDLTGLVPNTTYYYRATSADPSGNTTVSPEQSFLTPAASYTDTTVADFTAGTLDPGTAVRQTDDGEVALAGAAGSAEFFTFPTNWTSFPWDGSGSATVQAGQLVLDGARASTLAGVTYGPGASVEFRATFTAASFQNAGFAGGNDSAGGIFADLPWAMFGTPSGSTKLHARVGASGGSSVDVDLDPGNTLNLIGTPHTYRIDWTVVRVRVLRGRHQPPHHEATPIAEAMRVGASDAASGGPQLSLDWLRVSPYASTGTFVSRVFDGGGPTSWGTLSWTADTVGTTLAMSVRAGSNNPPTDGSWMPIAAPGPTGVAGRYLQYQAVLATTLADRTPVLQQVTITSNPIPDLTDPTIQTRTPAPGAAGVAPTANVVVQFSEEVRRSPGRPSTCAEPGPPRTFPRRSRPWARRPPSTPPPTWRSTRPTRSRSRARSPTSPSDRSAPTPSGPSPRPAPASPTPPLRTSRRRACPRAWPAPTTAAATSSCPRPSAPASTARHFPTAGPSREAPPRSAEAC